MVSRRARHRAGVDLSLDSLIDVFMNVLGVLMITAMVVALSARGPANPLQRKKLPRKRLRNPNQNHLALPSQSRFGCNCPSCSNRSPSRFMCC